ncbi:hypothetical protein GCM10022288_04190 [Gryllotalpicola kribbensis]|uniref:DUF559 domain-containing protein n=1 Tax=Gryllotalpicola kribbensis TaxID=993084 RepID=A0ABP8AHJ3_9MICO
MRHPEPLPTHLEAAPFTVAQADESGVSRDRLRARDLANPFRGVRVPRALLENADPDAQFAILCDAYQARMPRGWFFSGPTAARILGVPLPGRLEQLVVHVTAPTAFAPRGRFVVGHTAQNAETTLLFDRPVRVAAELWCELARFLTVDELIAAGDRMLSDKPVMLTTRRHLERALAAHGAGRGVRTLREALPQLRENVWSPRETWARLVIVRAGLPEPARNERIHGPDGKLIAIGDLVYRRWKVLVEYEGERWHRHRWSGIDVDRYNRLVLAGWTVIRVRRHHTAADVERMTREALLLKGWRP